MKNFVILQLGSEPASLEPGVLKWLNFELDVDLGVDYRSALLLLNKHSCSQCFYHLSIETTCLWSNFPLLSSVCPLFAFILLESILFYLSLLKQL